jgi:hypothetical protein
MESEPIGDRASLLTSAHFGVGFEFSALRSWEMKSPGGGPRLESGWGSEGPEIRVLRLPPWRVNLPGRRPGFENRWAHSRWRS